MAEKKEPDFKTLGVPGLSIWSGVLREEWLSELQGKKGRKVWREMRDNDSTVGSILFAISHILRGAQWSVEPGGDSRADREAADFLEQCMHDMETPWTEFISEVQSFLVYGFSVFEILWKVREGPDAPPSGRSKYSDKRIAWRDFSIRAQETIVRWDMDSSGNLKGLWQVAPPDYRERYIPAEKFILFRTEAHKGNPEGRSILRNCYLSWYFKKNLQILEGIGAERDLAGLPVLYVPYDYLTDPDKEKDRAWLQSLVENIRQDEEAGLLLPMDPYAEGGPRELMRLELISSAGSKQFDTSEIIQRYDHAIAQTVLADFVLLGLESKGSYALAREKRTVFETALIAWLDSIADTINAKAVRQLFEFNDFGIDNPPKLVARLPRVPDLDEVTKLIDALARAGAELFPDEDLENALRAQVGLPVKKTEA